MKFRKNLLRSMPQEEGQCQCPSLDMLKGITTLEEATCRYIADGENRLCVHCRIRCQPDNAEIWPEKEEDDDS